MVNVEDIKLNEIAVLNLTVFVIFKGTTSCEKLGEGASMKLSY